MANCFYDILSSWANVVTAVAALAAIVISSIAWYSSKKTYRYQVINEVFQEYRSADMGQAMRTIWEFQRSCTNENKTEEENKKALIDEYCRLYNEKEKNKLDSVHNARRKVSLYYQQIAALAAKDPAIKASVLEIWNNKYLRVIPEILEPIEMHALRRCTGETEFDGIKNYPQFMLDMLDLYVSKEPVNKHRSKIIKRIIEDKKRLTQIST